MITFERAKKITTQSKNLKRISFIFLNMEMKVNTSTMMAKKSGSAEMTNSCKVVDAPCPMLRSRIVGKIVAKMKNTKISAE